MGVSPIKASYAQRSSLSRRRACRRRTILDQAPAPIAMAAIATIVQQLGDGCLEASSMMASSQHSIRVYFFLSSTD